MAIPKIPDIPSPKDGPLGTSCQDLESQLDAKIQVLEQARDAIKAPQKLLDKELSKILGGPASTAGQITDATNTIESAVGDNTPATPNTDEIESILESCGLLNENILSGKTSPAAAIGAFVGKAADAVNDAVGSALDAIASVIEAPAATVVNAINDILNQIKVPDVLGSLDGILNCLDETCGSDISGKTDYVDNLLNDMKLDDTGALDLDTVFGDAGISTAQADNIKEVGTKILDSKDAAAEQTASAGESLGSGIKAITTPPPAVKKVISFFS